MTKGLKLCILWIGLLCSISCFGSMRDPTQPANYQAQTQLGGKHGFFVSSIIVSRDRRVAVVNNQVLQVGDHLSGATVVAIRQNVVQFMGPDGKFSVSLYEHVKVSEG